MKRSKRQWVLAVAAIAMGAAVLFGYYPSAPHRAPASQKPMLSLTADNVGQLREAFNAHPSHVRVIALLSPT